MVFDPTGSATSFSALLSTFGGSASQSSESSKPSMNIPLIRAIPSSKPSTTSQASKPTSSTTDKQSLNGNKPTNGSTKPGRPSPPVAGVKRKADSDISNVQERKDRPKPEASASSDISKPKPPKPTFGPAKMKSEPVSKPAAKPTITTTTRPAATAQPSATSSTTSTGKLSYKELMLERSKQKAATAVVGLPPPNVIPLKKTFTKEKKGWQKEILEKREAKTAKPAPGGKSDKLGGASSAAGGKVAFGSEKMKGSTVGGKGKGLAGGKGRPEPPAPKQPPPKPLFGPDLLKKRKEEAAPPVSAKRQKIPAGRDVGRAREREREPVYHKRYTYAEDYESDYDSADSSDMEATGLDILEEERFSERVAVKEDLREQKREEQLAAIKAARKGMKR